MFCIYIKRAAELFGVTHTRKIYEKAIEILPNEQTRYNFVVQNNMNYFNFIILYYIKSKFIELKCQAFFLLQCKS